MRPHRLGGVAATLRRRFFAPDTFLGRLVHRGSEARAKPGRPLPSQPPKRSEPAGRPALLAWDCAHRDAAMAGRQAFPGSSIFATIPAPGSLASTLVQADALTRALALQPDDAGIKAWLATVRHEQDDHASAQRQWTELAAVDPHDAYFALGLGQSLMACGESQAATQAFGRATENNPHSAEAWKGLAQAQRILGDRDSASASEARADFFAWLPPFFGIEYSDECYAKVRVLRSAGNAQPEKADLIRTLINDPSQAAAVLLAALCWHHRDHGAVEDQVFAALELRGVDTVPLRRAVPRRWDQRATRCGR